MTQGNVSKLDVDIFVLKLLKRQNGSEGEIKLLLQLTDLSFRRDITYASTSQEEHQDKMFPITNFLVTL